MAEWDPIGVDGIPEAADEYDSYIAGVYELLAAEATAAAISDFLRGIEVDRMGMVDVGGQPLLTESKRNGAVSSIRELSSHFIAA
jgi:hypothetical protein